MSTLLNAIFGLLLPILQQLFSLLLAVGKDLLPEIEQDATEYIRQFIAIASALISLQLSPESAKDSIRIMIDEIRIQGDVILGKIAVQAEKLPSELVGSFTSVLTDIPGKLLGLL